MPHRWAWETSCLPRTNHRKKHNIATDYQALKNMCATSHTRMQLKLLMTAENTMPWPKNHNAIANNNQIPIPQNARHKTTRMLCRTTLLIPSRYFKRLQAQVARKYPPTTTNRNPNRHDDTENPKYIPEPQRKFLKTRITLLTTTAGMKP
jgi:hypothetical protein